MQLSIAVASDKLAERAEVPAALTDPPPPRLVRRQCSSDAAHHGCGLSRDVTTKSVRSLPQLEQRNRSWVSGTSPRPVSMSACRSASAWCWQPPLHQTSSAT